MDVVSSLNSRLSLASSPRTLDSRSCRCYSTSNINARSLTCRLPKIHPRRHVATQVAAHNKNDSHPYTERTECDECFAPEQSPQDIAFVYPRRQTILTLASSLLLLGQGLQSPPSLAEETISDVPSSTEFEYMQDVINAYTFKFPLTIPSDNKRKISWVETRKPERYSSAAPLSPDARQRIVSERLDFLNNLTLSVSVGPPNKAFLSFQENPDAWRPIDVARSVLADKSTARMSVQQRVQEISIEDSSSSQKDGQTYWYYEHLAQKSPTIYDNSPDVYRHSLSVSAFREGYIYTLSVSTLNSKWPLVEDELHQCIDSFRLTPVTVDYVPPWKDPWRFW